MKANKFFAAALAALAFVGFTACQQQQPTAFELSDNALQMKVGETHQLTATNNVKIESWTSSNEQVATVNEGLITALAEGNAIISATAAGITKTCVVAVKNEGSSSGGAQVKGSQIWPLVMDAITAEANESKIVSDFRPDDVEKFFYIWDATYAANDNPTGKNFAGNTEGFMALTVGAMGWSGGGFFLADSTTFAEAAEELRQAIVANPDDYFLHLAIKSTDQGSHTFYMLNNEATKFGIGANAVYDAPANTLKNFTRDGSWAEFDIPMSTFAAALSTPLSGGINAFVVLSEGVNGVQLNMDAVYFYKK